MVQRFCFISWRLFDGEMLYLVKYMGSMTYISWSINFALYHCHRLKLFLYIKKWCRPGVFVSLRALALVWQTFYRNVPWVVLYQPYEFCPNRWIWLVAMATETLNLRKNIEKSPQKPSGGWSWNFVEMFITLASTKFLFFIAVTLVLLLLWQLKVSIDL